MEDVLKTPMEEMRLLGMHLLEIRMTSGMLLQKNLEGISPQIVSEVEVAQ